MKVAMQGQYHEAGKVLNIHFQFIILQESLIGPLKITINDKNLHVTTNSL
jgi:hypothetical protein